MRRNPECAKCENEITSAYCFRFAGKTYCSLECAAEAAGITEEWIEEEENDQD